LARGPVTYMLAARNRPSAALVHAVSVAFTRQP
jgi:hypothetical protein